jgi:predicted transcriptional regulator
VLTGAIGRHHATGVRNFTGQIPDCGVCSFGMTPPRIVSFRLAAEKIAELDSIAKAMDRDRSYLLNEAVDSYLHEQKRFVAMVEEGREDIRVGQSFTHAQVEAMIAEWELGDR